MSKSNIVITSTSPQGKTLQKTLTDINPAATNEQLATFGNMLNQLTDNVYGNTTKITKVNCDGEEGGGKALPTVTFTDTDYTTPAESINFKIPPTQAGDVTIYCHYTGDAKPYISIPECNIFFALMDDEEQRDGWFAVRIMSISGITFIPGKYPVVFYFPDTENYQEVSATILLDAEEE